MQDLIHGAAALYAGVELLGGLVAFAGIFVAFLDQEPVLAAAVFFAGFHTDEDKLAVEAIAMQPEFKIALGKSFVGVADWLPGAAVPDHHRPAAIFAFGNHALEAAIFERMVLGHHGKPFLTGVEARALGHGPALQHSVMLQPEIEMRARCCVLLDDETVALGFPALGPRLGRLGEVAPRLVFGEKVPVRSSCHGLSRLPSGCAFGSLLGGCGCALAGGVAGSRTRSSSALISSHTASGVLVLELLGVELACFALHQLLGEIERFLVDLDVLNFLEKGLRRANLVGVAQHLRMSPSPNGLIATMLP